VSADVDGQVEMLRSRLESLAEELADLALDRLREASESADARERLVAEERRFTRARRAVEKAAAVLDNRHEVD
jgi:predicted  nucleic acid-binding Zn-ribbon protein